MQLRPGQRGILWLTLVAVLFAGALLFLAPWRREDPTQVWLDAEAALKAQQIDRADQLSARLSRLREPIAQDWMLRAQVAIARDRADEAVADLARVPDSHPLAPQSLLLAGQVELRRNRLPAAEAAFLAALALDPQLVQAHRELIYIYGFQLRRSELNKHFRALSDLSPLTFDNAFHWCLTRYNTWEATDLLPDLERFIKGDPNDRWTRVALAECLRRLNRADEATAELAKLAPNDPEALVVRANIALDRGDHQGMEQLLALGSTDHAELARLRGRLALTRRDYKSALRYYRASYAAQPENRDTILGLGNALKSLGRNEDAAPFVALSRKYDALGTLLERAGSAEGRKDPLLARRLGEACEKIDRLPEARAWFSLAIAADPLDSTAQQSLHRVVAKMAETKSDRQLKSASPSS